MRRPDTTTTITLSLTFDLSIFHLLYFYISKILDSVAEGCPALEYIDVDVYARENHFHAGLIFCLHSFDEEDDHDYSREFATDEAFLCKILQKCKVFTD